MSEALEQDPQSMPHIGDSGVELGGYPPFQGAQAFWRLDVASPVVCPFPQIQEGKKENVEMGISPTFL